MRKFIVSSLLVLVGSGLWWTLSNTARFSIKKWDAKFDTVLRHTLFDLGFSQNDILSSVHRVQKSPTGDWVSHQITLRLDNPPKMEKLKELLESSGARVVERVRHQSSVLVVKRGSRIYQKIQFVKP